MAELSVVGKSVQRLDALEKVTGGARYTIDLKLPRMLHAAVLRSPLSHARIVRIDTSKAEAAPGVKAVITAKDIPVPPGKDAPTERVGYIRDRYFLARDKVRFAGESVAAVAAETQEEAEEALSLIKVDYQELPAIFDPEEAMKPNPPVVVHPDLPTYATITLPGWLKEPDLPNVLFHKRIRKGDLEKGFKDADVILEHRYSAARITHAALERFNALVEPRPDGGYNVWGTTHMAHRHRAEFARVFGIPPVKVRYMTMYMGGCFGNGTDALISQGIAAMLARKAGLPVRLVMSRQEVFQDGSTREPMIAYIRDGVKKDGTITARQVKCIVHAGAYAGLMPQVARSAPFGVVGTYRAENLQVDSFAVATNEPPACPFRGFGVAQLLTAVESHMDMVAAEIGMDPLEFRMKNLLKEGETDGTGQTTHAIGARECLEKVADWIGWNQPSEQTPGPWRRGKGIAIGNKNTTGGSTSVAQVKVHADGTIEVRHSVHEVGQGGLTAMAQIAAEEFRTGMERIKAVFVDTDITPFDYGTISSRATFHAGNAVLLACKDAKRKLMQVASLRLSVAPELLDIKDGTIYVKGVEERTIKFADVFSPLGFVPGGGELIGQGVYTGVIASEDLQTGQGKRVLAYFSHAATAAEVAVNVETGEVKVLRVASCLDMGQPINPKMCEQQLDSGTAMGIGAGLMEEVVVRNGKMVTTSFLDYKCPTAQDLPYAKDMASFLAPAPHREGPFGAKGGGEATMIAPPPAIAQAIYEAVGVRLHDTPFTKEKVLEALRKKAAIPRVAP